MADEDEGTEVEIEDEGTEAAEDEPTTLEEWKARAEKLAAEGKATAASLAKANRERERLKRRASDATAPAKKAAPAGDKKDDGPEVSPDSLAKLEAATKEAQTWKSKAIRDKAKVALAQAGVDPKRVDRIVRLLDESYLDIDDEDKLTGISDQIEDLQDEWPEFFGKPKPEAPEPEAKPRPPRDRRANRDAADKADQGAPKKSIAEERASRVLGLTSR
jgi:hypothetical protein